MTTRIYVVYDRLACESGPLFEAKNDAVSRRQYDKLIQRTARPEEYQLLCIGMMDHDVNKLTVFDKPEEVGFQEVYE